MRKNLIFCALILLSVLLLFSPASARYVDVFQELGVSARALGMGNVYTGCSIDAADASLNPAGIAGAKKKEAGVMYSSVFESLGTYAGFNLAVPVAAGVIGVSMLTLGVSAIPDTRNLIVDGAGLVEYDPNSIGSGSDQLTSTNVSYAINAGGILVGVNGKAISERTFGKTADRVGVDVNVMYKGREGSRLRAGIIARDLVGTNMKWSTGAEDAAEMSLRAGIGYVMDLLTIGIDVDMKYGSDVSFGLELSPAKMIDIRLGQKSNGGRGDMTAGLGMKIGNASALDFAYTSFADLGSIYRAGLTFKF